MTLASTPVFEWRSGGLLTCEPATNGCDGDAFVGFVLTRAVQARHLAGAAMMDGDHVPAVVEHGTSGTARIGRRAVVDQAMRLVEIEEVTVMERDLQPRAPRVPGDERARLRGEYRQAWRGFQADGSIGQVTKRGHHHLGVLVV